MRKTQFHNCQHKSNNYDKKYLWLQNIQSRGFCRVFAGVYLSSRMILFCKLETWTFCPDNFHSLSFTMDTNKHSYAMADSTTISIHLVCGQDFPDAVPFHVTEMQDLFSTHPGECNLWMLCTTIITACAGDYYNYFLSIMAHFLDEEEHRKYIDITSTSKDQDAPQAGAVGGGGLPTLPHQPPMEVRTTQLFKTWRTGGCPFSLWCTGPTSTAPCRSLMKEPRKFTIPQKEWQSFGVFGVVIALIASMRDLQGVMHGLPSCMRMLCPMYTSLVLKNWHFFGEIFKPYLIRMRNSQINSVMWSFCLLWIRQSSIMAMWCFLDGISSKTFVMKFCQMAGETDRPIPSLW